MQVQGNVPTVATALARALPLIPKWGQQAHFDSRVEPRIGHHRFRGNHDPKSNQQTAAAPLRTIGARFWHLHSALVFEKSKPAIPKRLESCGALVLQI